MVLTTTVLVASALIAGTTVSVWQAILARRARADAIAQRDRARKAVDEMYTEVAEQWLSQQPKLEPLQRDFLMKAAGLLSGIRPGASRRSCWGAGAASAELRAGDILKKLGEHDRAEQAYRRALKLHEALATDFPRKPEYRRIPADSYRTLGILLHDAGRFKEAELDYRRSMQYTEELLAEFPKDPQYSHELARVLVNLGGLYS